MGEIKNPEKLTRYHFRWQDGYGAFSYSPWDKDKIINYIKHQEEHHKRVNFRKEYKKLLDEFGVEYDERYLLDDI